MDTCKFWTGPSWVFVGFGRAPRWVFVGFGWAPKWVFVGFGRAPIFVLVGFGRAKMGIGRAPRIYWLGRSPVLRDPTFAGGTWTSIFEFGLNFVNSGA